MSRAFMKEDSEGPGNRYPLPPQDDPGFPLAAARTLLAGANVGDSIGAEEATGYRWGDPRLTGEVKAILQEAIDRRDERLETLAERYLLAAAQGTTDRPG